MAHFFQPLEPGQLVYANGLANTGLPFDPPPRSPYITFYGSINLQNYPSCDDYDIKTALDVPDGEAVMIVELIGRPWKIEMKYIATRTPRTSPIPGSHEADVYAVLVGEEVKHVLRHWVRVHPTVREVGL